MYNESSIVCGKSVDFTPEETVKVSAFHKSRIAFGLYQGKLLTNEYDEREHRVYLQEDFEIDDETFETLVRGYIKAGRIVLYKSSYYYAIEPWELKEFPIDAALELAVKFFGSGTYEIWNGVKVSEIGTEWPPIQIVSAISDKDTHCYFCGVDTSFYDKVFHRWACMDCADVDHGGGHI